ncbi:MAG: response regulator [Phycisphaerae bacterium]|jgi:CheY-like chemotaxis protein|nr:response regulator [Phycisphaerae bacterium]
MAERGGDRKLLVLRGPSLEAEGILGFLSEHFDVHVTAELDEALSAIEREEYAAVLSETADFLPLERGAVTQQAAVVLNTLGDGVGIVDRGGELVWANRRLRRLAREVLNPLREICVKAFKEFDKSEDNRDDRGRRFSIKPDERQYIEVICSPIRDIEGNIRHIAAVVVDASGQMRQQLKLNAIDRAGRELAHLDFETLSKLDASERLRLLEEKIISCSRDVLDYQHFAVLLLDQNTNRLEIIVSEGLSQDALEFEIFARTEGNGICGYVASTGRSYICPDVSKDTLYLQGMPDAKSCLTTPLLLGDRVIGVLHVESDRPAMFSEADRQFAEIFANYLAISLHILNLLVAERYSTHTQLTGSMSAELAGPINDMITDATELMEDYIGIDEIRQRLGAIIDRACQARKSLTAWSGSAVGAVTGTVESSGYDAALAGKCILVADDEPLLRETVRDVLQPCGCTVDLACDGQDAIEKISAKKYDLVISDIKMPGADGYEVFEAARTASGDTAVILMTAFGYDPKHSIVRANREGLSSVLFKPFKVNQLLDECRTAISP